MLASASSAQAGECSPYLEAKVARKDREFDEAAPRVGIEYLRLVEFVGHAQEGCGK